MSESQAIQEANPPPNGYSVGYGRPPLHTRFNPDTGRIAGAKAWEARRSRKLAAQTAPAPNPEIPAQPDPKPEGAKRLWWEITLADAHNYLLNPAKSKIDWKPGLTTFDKRSVKTAPLSQSDVERLGSLKDTLVVSASCVIGASTQHVSISPAEFVSHRTAHISAKVPPYHEWNTRSYFAKAERELDFIASLRQSPLGNRHLKLEWRITPGLGTGGGNLVSRPLQVH